MSLRLTAALGQRNRKPRVTTAISGRATVQRLLATCVALIIMLPIHAAAPDPTRVWSENHQFQVTRESSPAPIPLLALHSWTLTIADRAGAPVDAAQLTVMGGMPEHGHGLPTRPVVRAQGGGRYLIDGLRFHMPGRWVVAIRIRTATAIDTVTFPLEMP